MFPLQSYPPMTMVDFFEASRGTWLNRRAVHHLDHQDDEAADSNLVIEPFKNDDPAVRSICEALNINTIDSTGGARFWWESNIKKGVIERVIRPAFMDYLQLYLNLVAEAQPVNDDRAELLLSGQKRYTAYRAEKDPARGMLTQLVAQRDSQQSKS